MVGDGWGGRWCARDGEQRRRWGQDGLVNRRRNAGSVFRFRTLSTHGRRPPAAERRLEEHSPRHSLHPRFAHHSPQKRHTPPPPRTLLHRQPAPPLAHRRSRRSSLRLHTPNDRHLPPNNPPPPRRRPQLPNLLHPTPRKRLPHLAPTHQNPLSPRTLLPPPPPRPTNPRTPRRPHPPRPFRSPHRLPPNLQIQRKSAPQRLRLKSLRRILGLVQTPPPQLVRSDTLPGHAAVDEAVARADTNTWL